MKTLDINAKEWFDKVNGNIYFSAVVIVDYGTKKEKMLTLPLQYGYGDHYQYEAMTELVAKGLLPEFIKEGDTMRETNSIAPWRYCQDNNIILRTSKQENCLKRELTQ